MAGFPDTVDEALRLSGMSILSAGLQRSANQYADWTARDINRLLHDLDAETDGDVSARRRRLLFCAGVTQLGVGPYTQ